MQWLRALNEVDPVAAEQLAAVTVDDSVPVFDAQTLQEGTRLFERSSGIARDWLGQQIPCPNVIVVPGITQFDLIKPLLRQKTSIKVLLLERDGAKLVAHLNAADDPFLAESIAAKRLVIDPGGDDNNSVNRFIEAVDFSRIPRIRMLDARSMPETAFQMAADMTQAARELIRLQSCDLSTRLRFGADWQEQAIRNVPLMVQHAPVRSLFDQFKGLPALVIGAGPSLNDAIDEIFALRKHFVVIAVGRVVGFLQRRSTRMHLVVSGDGQQIVRNHFEAKPSGVPVVASLFSPTDVIRELDRMFFMDMESMNLPRWISRKVGELGEVYPGGNVTTAAMSLAVKMGCNPVLTAGLDFSYPADGQTHAAGVKGSGLKSDVSYYDVPGNYEPFVKTNRQMRHYIDFTRDLVKNHAHTRFINVNTAGARIDGMELVRPECLKEFAAKEMLQRPVRTKIATLYETQCGSDARVSHCRHSLTLDLPVLRELRDACIEAAMQSNRLIMLMRRPGSVTDPEGELRRLLATLEPLDRKLREDPIMDLLDARLEPVSHGLTERMLTTEERAESPAVRSHRRWRTFYRGVAEACEKTEAVLKTIIESMEISETACDRSSETHQITGATIC